MPARVLGVAAGGLIVITNAKTLLEGWAGVEPNSTVLWLVVGTLAIVWITLISAAVNAERVVRRAEAGEGEVVAA